MNFTKIISTIGKWNCTLLLLILAAGCDTLTGTLHPTITPVWSDANAVVQGICFEAANDAAEQVFILRNEADLTAFYDLADHSELCRHPAARQPFDFDTAILAGLWSQGSGCTARHDVLLAEQDDIHKTLRMKLRFVTEGHCNYELVRPFWAALSIPDDYTVDLLVEG